MLDRRAATLVQDRLAEMPAVAIVGPRQAGKTTLARTLGQTVFDLELETDRLKLDLTFDARAAQVGLVVLDEVQACPEIFPRLRAAIDADRRRMGRFLLLGSVPPALMREVSESLAGRLGLVELTPFLWRELVAAADDDVGDATADRLWACGGFPDGGVLGSSAFPRWQRDYLALLTQRDLPTWGLSAKPRTTERLLRMVAAVHGQAHNASRLAQSLGISYHTAEGYLDHLEGAFLIRRLPAFATNTAKRLVKSPKLYVRDSGLLHALLGLSDPASLLDAPWVGASYEGFVIEQILGHLSAAGHAPEASYLRTSDGYEIDLVLAHAGELWAIEVKLTSSPSTQDVARVVKTADLIGATRRVLLSRTKDAVEGAGVLSCDLPHLLERLGV